MAPPFSTFIRCYLPEGHEHVTLGILFTLIVPLNERPQVMVAKLEIGPAQAPHRRVYESLNPKGLGYHH